MRLSDKSLKEIISERLWWEDFEESPEDVVQIMSAAKDTSEGIKKIN